MIGALTPLKQKKNKKKVFGFDIETYDNNKKFLCASIYDIQERKVYFFTDKNKLLDFFDDTSFNDSYIVSTNLQFDFFGVFNGDSRIEKYKLCFRNSHFISATRNDKHHKFIFIDTLNFAQMSVKKLGDIVGIPKIDKPEFLGNIPKDENEWEILRRYNINDSLISASFFRFFIDVSENLGATVKQTIASSAMNLFRNKYLKEIYWQANTEILKELFNAYYGGRCEVFQRGIIEDANYYDINSLYPAMMKNDFPDPNSIRVNNKNTVAYIKNFEGVADVDLFCPDTITIPLLPVKRDKLIFPTGNISGYYSNVELRKAMELGYVIKKVRRNIYFKKTCRPFDEYVDDLYSLRKKFKDEKSPAENIVKLYMNSLYGKFGQKFGEREELIHESRVDLEMLKKHKRFERVGDFFRIVKNESMPAVFCCPIWALYVTAYARLRLYEYLTKHNPIYCDTDSIITKDVIPESKKLGEMKLEMHIDFGIIIKPKFYYTFSENKCILRLKGSQIFESKEMIKIKGVKSVLNSKGDMLDYERFLDIIKSREIMFEKFAKFKESLRRKIIPNEIIELKKKIDCEDDKRVWPDSFNFEILQYSLPINI